MGTLADREGRSIRDDLRAFYQHFYSANLMTLTVVSNQRLDDLQKMVETRFVQIPNRNKTIDENYPTLFFPGVLPASLSIKPVNTKPNHGITLPTYWVTSRPVVCWHC
jgi:secreted Zn-dependent insulinase-like peptidase